MKLRIQFNIRACVKTLIAFRTENEFAEDKWKYIFGIVQLCSFVVLMSSLLLFKNFEFRIAQYDAKRMEKMNTKHKIWIYVHHY